MSFQPIVPSGGLTGWAFLQRTADSQRMALSEDVTVRRLTDTFRDRIGDISSAEALVEDRALLTVALTAFGLEEDLNNKFYIKTILEQDPSDPQSLSNKLADKRYLEFAEAFNFGGPTGAKTRLSGFADSIIEKYDTNDFKTRVGELDNDLRLALGIEDDLSKISENATANDTKWFSIMGNPPLRRVFEVAFGLPSAFGTLSIDRQLEVLKEKSLSVLGTDEVADVLDPETLEKLTNTFLLRAQLDTSATSSSGTIALTLLQSTPNLNPPLF